MTIFISKNALAIAITLASSWSACAQAQTTAPAEAEPAPAHQARTAAEGATLTDIIVTASRLRSEAVQDTPVAVAVFSSEQLAALNTADIRGISATVPNLMVTTNGTLPGQALISIRGFNTLSGDISVEPGIVTYLDGVYQPLTWGNLSDLYDVDRLEVLRGPQGTLLGKNVAAGAILITRSRPTGEFGGKVKAEYGTANLVELNGLLNFPIIQDKLAGKIFASYRRRDDYVKNLDIPGGDAGGQKYGSIRAAILANPTDNLEWYLSADYTRDRTAQGGPRNLAGPTGIACSQYGYCALDAGRRNVTHINFLDGNKSTRHSVTSNIDWSLGGVKVTAITGYQRFKLLSNADIDASPVDLLKSFNVNVRLKGISQEVRLSSEEGGGLDLDGRLSWLVAGYYNHSTAENFQSLFSLGRNLTAHQRVERETKALFGFAEYEVIDGLSASFGARRSWDDVDHRFASNTPGLTPPPYVKREDRGFANTSFEGGLRYEIDPDKMVYARYAEGYRGGGFVGLPSTPANSRGFDSETSQSHEIGVKTQWWDRRLLLNVTLFRTKFDDLQRTTTLVGPNNTFIQSTSNAAAATSKGIEFEAVLKPADGFTLRANGGYLDIKYTCFDSLTSTGQVLDLTATPFAYAPKYTGGANVEYRTDIPDGAFPFNSVTFRAAVNYLSKHIASNNVATLAARQPGYELVDGSINFESDAGYNLSFYVRNATKQGYLNFATDIAGISTFAFDGLGRTWGVTVGVEF